MYLTSFIGALFLLADISIYFQSSANKLLCFWSRTWAKHIQFKTYSVVTPQYVFTEINIKFIKTKIKLHKSFHKSLVSVSHEKYMNAYSSILINISKFVCKRIKYVRSAALTLLTCTGSHSDANATTTTTTRRVTRLRPRCDFTDICTPLPWCHRRIIIRT